MSLFTDASLVMIPSGVKDGKLYSIKPDDGVGDFTFTRGSNLAATRVDENGLIEKGRENLLLQSNQFDTTWTSSGTLIDGQTDKDGGINAWSFTPSTGASGLAQNVSATGVKTFSVYIKKNATNGVRVYMFGSLNVSPFFNLNTGSVVSLSNAIDAKIEEYNVDWWRISVTTPDTTLTSIYLYTTDNSTTQVVGTITFQDAQLERGLVATDYIETGATSEQAGILENLPRLDYTDSSCPSLLLEPTRTNLVTHSEYFGSSSWTRTATTITPNQVVSPEGITNAAQLNIPITGSNLTTTVTVSASTSYVFSFYVKRGSATELKYSIYDWSNLADIISPTSYFSQTSTTEWTRIEVQFTTPVGCTSVGLYIDRLSFGNGNVYIYGAQLEAGSYPTSYIPTYGTSVTRSGDVCFGAGDATTFNDSEGVLFIEASGLADPPPSNIYISLSDGTSSNFLSIRHRNNGEIEVLNNGTFPSNIVVSSNQVLSDILKVAIKYGNSTEDYKIYINGSSIAVAGTFVASVMTGLNVLDFDYPTGSFPFNGNVKKAIVFPTALTDSELAALTTI